MATMTAETLNDNSFYVSAPSSPGNMCLYSVPASPARKSFENFYDIPETEPTPPREGYEDANTSFIEFEFETSRWFNVEDDEHDGHEGAEAGRLNLASPCKKKQQQEEEEQHQRKESFPSMAFADELFCNGKVMPLKLPPRFQYNNESISTSALSSAKSPVMKFPLLRRSLWNDDYDPFMAALENIREESKEKIHRRARSMSPLRVISLPKLDKQKEIEESERKQNLMEAKANSFADYSIWVPNKNRHKCCHGTVQKTPMRSEPKGALLARLVKMGQEKPTKPSGEKLSKEECAKESEEPCNRESKRANVKRFLFGSSSMGRTNNEEKTKEAREVFPKQSFTRKLSSRSTGLAQYNEEKRVSKAANMTLAQYRPKLFLCVGYGATKYVK